MKQQFRVRLGEPDDFDPLARMDWFPDKERIREKLLKGEILVIAEAGQITGFLRYSWFWDYLPFIDLLWVEDGFRREGRASCLIAKLEEMTQGRNHRMILTSTLSNEDGQDFFRKIGFVDSGGLILRGQPLELLMVKYLSDG